MLLRDIVYTETKEPFYYVRDFGPFEIDGIVYQRTTSPTNQHGGYFFNFRFNHDDDEFANTPLDQDGYANEDLHEVLWNGQFISEALPEGGMVSDELWLKFGYIIVVDQDGSHFWDLYEARWRPMDQHPRAYELPTMSGSSRS